MKRKSGLHKKISSIFDGVPVPGLERRPEQQNEPDININADQTAEPAQKDNSSFEEKTSFAENKPKTVRKKLKENQQAEQTENTHVENTNHEIDQSEYEETAPADDRSDIQLDCQNKTDKNSDAEADTTHEPPVKKIPARPAKKKKRKTSKNAIKIKLINIWQKIALKLYGVPADQVDKKQKILTLSIPFLTIIFAIVIWNILGIGRKTQASAEPGQTKKTQTITNAQINWEKPPKLPETIRDPMKYSSTASTQAANAKTPDTFEISGIVYNQQNPEKSFVIFQNGQMLSAGQNLRGAEITNIKPKQVTFKTKNRTWTQQIAEINQN
jgi:hypothetical protein